jgi:fumarate hydratase class II
MPSLMKLKSTLGGQVRGLQGHRQDRPTHLQDATPLTWGRSSRATRPQLEQADRHLHGSLPHLCELALGGTAVGHRPERPAGYAERWQRNWRGSRACLS